MESSVRVLFVCLGNICRSPMAEAVMRHLTEKEGLDSRIEIDSAGTGDWHIGHPPHEGTRKVLDTHGISYKGMKARQVSRDDHSHFSYIVCMDRKNLSDVQLLFPNDEAHAGNVSSDGSATKLSKLFTFMELVPERGVVDVPDPYYEGNFDYVYELVEEGCKALLKRIKADMAWG